ncbi:hypothetical protein [Streptomyces sp. NBC_01408]|uniref:hypothetical protein n=1 Tax=Streptomyces sp. NBC_01408 TaxID=2903855 RepID=UPI00224E48A0|nr:hypothetical protein [Streptomyces sp. NBC_01408]MCX4694912.1 hypothetical protein [Streptomyces sp. NBC_01408]
MAGSDDGGAHPAKAQDGGPTAWTGPAVCPRCGRADQVLGVPAAYLAAKATHREETGTGDEKKVTVSEENSALAGALAAAPPEPSDESTGCWAGALMLTAVGSFIWGAIAGKWFDRDGARRLVETGNGDGRFVADPSYVFLGWISGTSLVLGLLLILILNRTAAVWRRRTEPGRDEADRVWSAGWYCGRCGSVHFSLGRSMTLREFRARVWSAGGYGDLAAKHPAL